MFCFTLLIYPLHCMIFIFLYLLFVFFYRLEKENIQHCISNEAKARALQAQQREQELTQKMQQMEAQHEKTGRW